VYLIPPPSAIKNLIGGDPKLAVPPFSYPMCDSLDTATVGAVYWLSNGVPGLSTQPFLSSPSWDPAYKAGVADYHLELGGFVVGTSQADTTIMVAKSPWIGADGQRYDFMAAVNDYPCEDMISNGQRTKAEYLDPTVSWVGPPGYAFAIDGLPAGVVGYAYPSPIWSPDAPDDMPAAQIPSPGYAALYAQQDGYFIDMTYQYDDNGPQSAKAGRVMELVMQTVHDNYQQVDQMSVPPNCSEVASYLEVAAPSGHCGTF